MEDSRMHKILSAALLCLALAPALAADAPPGRTPPAQDGLMHASLVVPAANAATAARTPQKQAPQTAAADAGAKEDTGNATSTGMLLAALVLMLGIVLRRWGTDAAQ
jgi:hypothetical protein